jgi:D-aminoacyl-tRNA deacylase
MYKKYLVVASKEDKAGINITTQLSQFKKNPIASILQKDEKGFDFYLVDGEILYNQNLDLEKINRYDFVIFASKHSSSRNEKALAIHAVGNWRDAKLGGEAGKIGKTSAVFAKYLFEKLNQNAAENALKNYDITMEATHHGPLIEKPCIFIEIGSTETEYNDRRAGFIVARTLLDVIENFRENPYNEIAVGIGGPHYCPNFNKIQERTNVAISHVIPSYVFPVTEEMVLEAIRKTEEEVDFVLLDWKGLGVAEEREKLIQILEKNYIQWKKTSDVKN